MSISEASIPGEEAGRVKAKDPDIGENGLVTYNIIDGDGIDMFEITTDYETQEGVVKLKKVNNAILFFLLMYNTLHFLSMPHSKYNSNKLSLIVGQSRQMHLGIICLWSHD